MMNRITVNQGDSLAAKLTTENALYVISGACDLAGAEVIVPRGSTLVFDYGTKIKNGKLVLNNTVFEGAKHCVATEVCGVQDELDTDYFDLTLDNKTSIMQSLVDTAKTIQLHGRLENVFDNIEIGNNLTSLIGNGATILNTSTRSTAAMVITTNTYTKIEDISFVINSGCAISKNAGREGRTKLSFMIDRCRFKSTSEDVPALIELINSREGNITNCFFEYKNGDNQYGSIGIDRGNAVNTNVIGCMFNNLNYGIKALAVHDSDDPDDENDGYTSYACGLNVQSAVMLGCKYGIYIEGNDSFFLNNSMIDFCVNPLVVISQDGANITNNYFSAAEHPTADYDYPAVIVVRNNSDKGYKEMNKRIIISGNTIYGHRTVLCYGMDMDVESIDCTIQGNTFDNFIVHGILLRHNNTGDQWLMEKLVIDNNRFHFNTAVNVINMDGICGDNYTGSNPVIITNNYAIEERRIEGNIHVTTKLIEAGNSYFGNYLSYGNHDYLVSAPSGDVNNRAFLASRMNNSRMKIQISIPSALTSMDYDNPMPGESNIVVYVANNPCPICVSFENFAQGKITFTKPVTNTTVTFTAIFERSYNM